METLKEKKLYKLCPDRCAPFVITFDIVDIADEKIVGERTIQKNDVYLCTEITKRKQRWKKEEISGGFFLVSNAEAVAEAVVVFIGKNDLDLLVEARPTK